MTLDPPYDRYAVWHEHFFAPDGNWYEMDAPLSINGLCPNGVLCRAPDYGHCHDFGCYEVQVNNETIGRYDAVEDRLGRIFVWKAETMEVVQVCSSREEASRIARGLATI